jgi:hypothetical protein
MIMKIPNPTAASVHHFRFSFVIRRDLIAAKTRPTRDRPASAGRTIPAIVSG